MVWRWSKTAASNSNADSSINWAEGMAPSAVNDSARAEMARVAQWRDDISGAIVTTGTSTVYSVSSNQVFDTLAHMDGTMIAFTPHATNTGAVTLNVDSIAAKPLRSAPGLELPSGTLVLGTPYVATYNNSDAVWYLQGGLSNPYNVPLCSGLDYWGATALNSAFAFPVGQAVSRTTYATAFAILGTTYGSGDGSTTFNLPDKTGRVSAMREVTASRLTSTYFGTNSTVLGAASGLDNHQLTVTELPTFTPTTASIQQPTFNYLQFQVGGTGAQSGSGAGAPTSYGGVTAAATRTTDVAVTMNSIGSNAPHSIIQPTILCNYILRII